MFLAHPPHLPPAAARAGEEIHEGQSGRDGGGHFIALPRRRFCPQSVGRELMGHFTTCESPDEAPRYLRIRKLRITVRAKASPSGLPWGAKDVVPPDGFLIVVGSKVRVTTTR